MTPRWKNGAPLSSVLDLAEHVERADREVLARSPPPPWLDRDLGDDADDERGAGADAEEIADGRAQVVRAADRESAPAPGCR